MKKRLLPLMLVLLLTLQNASPAFAKEAALPDAENGIETVTADSTEETPSLAEPDYLDPALSEESPSEDWDETVHPGLTREDLYETDPPVEEESEAVESDISYNETSYNEEFPYEEELPEETVSYDAANAETVVSGDWSYQLTSGDGIVLTGWTGTEEELKIPRELDGFPVTTLADSLFRNNQTLTRVLLPRTLEEIGSYVFYGCTELTEITFEDLELDEEGNPIGEYVLSSVGSQAFRDCTSLKRFAFPDTEEPLTLGSSLFQNAAALEEVSLGKGIAVLPSNLFRDCSFLQTLEIRGTITSVSSNSLYNVALKTILLGPEAGTLPSSLLTIDTLESFTAAPENTVYSTADGILYNADGTELVRCPAAGSAEELIIPDKVSAIAASAFANNVRLVSVIIPDSVTEIGTYAFSNCSSLASAEVGTGISVLPMYMFRGCSALRTLALNGNVTSLSSGAVTSVNLTTLILGKENTTLLSTLTGLASLEEILVAAGNPSYQDMDGVLYSADGTNLIKVPKAWSGTGGTLAVAEGTQNISGSAAEYNTRLVSVTIPDSVTSLGSYAFRGCTSLAEVSLGAGITSLPGYVFNNCSSLTSLSVAGALSSVTSNALSGTAISHLHLGPAATALSSTLTDLSSIAAFTVDEANPSYQVIDEVLYQNECTVLVRCPAAAELQTVTIPETVITINNYAFQNCVSLTSVTIPDTVTGLGSYAFSGCTALAEATLGSGITALNSRIFNNCSSLQSLTVNGRISSVNSTAFYGASPASLHIGPDVTSLVRDLTNLGSLTVITVDEENPYLKIWDGVLCSFDGTDVIRCPVGNTSASHTLPETAVQIDDYAFYNCTALTSVVIPDTVTTIGGSAFRGCTSLASVTLGSSLTSIGSNAFTGCSALTHLTINSTLTSIGGSAFSGVPALDLTIGPDAADVTRLLNNITINSVTMDPANTGYQLNGHLMLNAAGTTLLRSIASADTTELVIPDTVTTINNYAFQNDPYLTSVTIPDSVTSIGSYAFSGCKALTYASLGSGITVIPNYLFYNCSALTELHVEGDIASCGGSFVSGCSALTTLSLGSQVTSATASLLEIATLVQISVDEGNSAFRSIDGVLFSADGSRLIRYPMGKEGTSYAIPEGTAVIAERAFYGDRQLTELILPEGITELEASALYGASAITSLVLPHSLEIIRNAAFSGMSKLTEITLQSSPEIIENGAVPTDKSRTIWLGDGADAVHETLLSNRYLSIVPAEGNSFFVLTDGVLYTADGTQLIRYTGDSSVTSYTIPETVTVIGPYAFLLGSSLKEIVLPEALTSVGCQAFYNRSGASITGTPAGLTFVDAYAFYNCSGLISSLTFVGGAYIGEYAFYKCTGLTELTYIGTEATPEEPSEDPSVDPDTYSVPAAGAMLSDGTANTDADDAAEYPSSIGANAFFGCSALSMLNFLKDAPLITLSTFTGVTGDLLYEFGFDRWGEFLDNLTNSTINARENKETERAIALVVDCSGSMQGDPISALREAVSQFCSTVLTGDIPTQIVLVYYSSDARVYGYTSNNNLLLTKALTLSANGGTNLYSAIDRADRLLQSITAKEKDMILMTDGMPESGQTSSTGPFTSSDSTYYAYGNACVARFKELSSNYRVFSMGFFHTLSGSEKDYASRLLQLLQNAGYYEVSSIDSLLEIFGEMTQTLLMPLDIQIQTTATTIRKSDGSEAPGFRVTAKVSNNNTIAASGVKAKIDLDSTEVHNFTIGLKLNTQEELVMGDIPADGVLFGTWTVEAPSILVDRDYQFGIVAGAENAVATEAFHTVTVPADLSKASLGEADHWSFHHSFGTYRISDKWLSYLYQAAGSSESEVLKEYYLSHRYEKDASGNFDYSKPKAWGGSCYGMSLAAGLLKRGDLTPGYWQSGAASTNQISQNNGIDLINYCYVLQGSKADDINRAHYNSAAYIRALEAQIAKEGFAVFGFNYGGWYNQTITRNGKQYNRGDMYTAGHEIIAVGAPIEGTYKYTLTYAPSVDAVTSKEITFDRAIPTYDINLLGSSNKQVSYLYYKSDYSAFFVPQYMSHDYGGSRYYVDYDNNQSRINSLIDHPEAYAKYSPERAGYTADTLKTNQIRVIAENRTLTIKNAQNQQSIVDGLSASGDLNLWPFYNAMEAEDYYSEPLLNVYIYDTENTYTISTEDSEPLDFAARYDESAVVAQASSGSEITFQAEDGISMTGNEGSYSLTYVNDNSLGEQIGDSVTVSGEGQSAVTVENTEEGVIVRSEDGLQNVSVTLADEAEVTLDLTDNSVLITTEENTNVVKTDTDGDGSYEETVEELTPPAPVLPEAPAAPTLSNASAGIMVKWTAVEGAESYVVEKRTGSGEWAELGTTEKESWSDKAATANGTRYQYRIRTVAGGLTGDPSKVSTIYRLNRGKIASVTNVSSKTARIQWTRNTRATGYQVQYATKSSFAKAYRTGKNFSGYASLKWNVGAMKNGTVYYVRTRTVKKVGSTTYYSAWSPVVKFARLSTVTLSSVKASSGRKLTVSWKKNAKATGYQIQYSTSSKFTAKTTKKVTITKASTVKRVLSGLAKKTYYVRIRAYRKVDSKTTSYSAWSVVKKASVTS